jgi:hypothetical protein
MRRPKRDVDAFSLPLPACGEMVGVRTRYNPNTPRRQLDEIVSGLAQLVERMQCPVERTGGTGPSSAPDGAHPLCRAGTEVFAQAWRVHVPEVLKGE